ncbi:MAG: polyamine aminopropyltransferase [Pseudomonadota bacterium]
MTRHFEETLYDSYGQRFRVDEVLFENETDHQHLIIFRNERFGRVMVLDGVVQTTEADEFVYHEMLTHVPLLAHGAAKRVLIVGGGDGGVLREVTRHRSVERIVQVEIDRAVIDMAKTWLPNHSAGAFDDSRAEIVIGDGMDFVATTDERFDVIISDSTDPIGPGEVLFTRDFYAGCQRCLNPGGVVATQNGVAFLQLDEVTTTARRLGAQFSDTTFYAASVPTYVGGVMTFAWGTDDPALRQTDLTTLEQRFAAADLPTRYYTPAIHCAAFALPRYIENAIEAAGR